MEVAYKHEITVIKLMYTLTQKQLSFPKDNASKKGGIHSIAHLA